MSASRSPRWAEPGRTPKTLAALDQLVSDHSRGGTVAIVEDDPDIASVLQLHLEEASYRVRVAHDGRGGLQIAHRELVDLVVLDLVLPDLDGLEVCRSFALRVPRPLILILSSRGTEMDRVRGLNVGADDYLVKPFSVLEFVARVRALFRRPPAELQRRDAEHMAFAGALILDRWQRCARLHGERIELTGREFDLLSWLVHHPHRIFSRSELLDAVWGRAYDGFEHTVNSHLNRLRAKLERDPSRPEILITVRGGGYKLVPPGNSDRVSAR
ncbi:MAG: response regulator transcription factor [Burkholderiaceae bacterium]|nr:response regulator transcription factor [Burkholderiaceae bacterium]